MCGRILLLPAVCGLLLLGCSVGPDTLIVEPTPPGPDVYRLAARRLTAIVVSSEANVGAWLSGRLTPKRAPKDADGGSAVPISPDGYFLTADHVLATAEGRNIHVIYGTKGSLGTARARVVRRWDDGDLALIHAPMPTPHYYEWTPSGQSLPTGTGVMHAGIATGFRSPSGKLITPVGPDRSFGRPQRFKHDIPLEPGDSGGPVVDSRGLLVGVNSAVEFLVPLETAFFIESEANRPNLRTLQSVMAADRKDHPYGGGRP